MRVLLRLTKGEEIQYISHLDMQRLFQRALRRAKLPCAYSNGFNPHVLLSFACALPVGVCSNAEYAEVQLEKFVPPTEVMNRLNAVLPDGVRVLNATEPKDDYPLVGSVIALAEYSLEPEKDADEAIIRALLAEKEIKIEKKTKKGMAEVDVRGLIAGLHVHENTVKATLATSNTENLRADKLAELLAARGMPIKKITREKLFVIVNGQLEEPLGEKA